MPKDRRTERGDVEGPLECSLTLGSVAAETQGSTAVRQAAGTVLGLACTILQRNSVCRQPTRSDCMNQQTSSLVAQRSTPVLMIRSTRCRKRGSLAD